jgi:hypothetical protein
MGIKKKRKEKKRTEKGKMNKILQNLFTAIMRNVKLTKRPFLHSNTFVHKPPDIAVGSF